MDFLNKEFIDDGSVDPVYRCDSCQELLLLSTLHKLGSCSKCGNKRVRNVTIFNDEEKEKMEAWGLTKFVSEFEAVPDA